MSFERRTIFNGRTIVTATKESYTLSANQFIAEGGEAEIYEIGKATAAKIYKEPSKPISLRDKLIILSGLQVHENVILPRQLAYFADNNSVCGFTLRLLRNVSSLDAFMWQPGLNEKEEADLDIMNAGLLFDLCDILEALHRNRIFYGDLKQDNVLAADQRAYLVDFDSSSIPGYPGNCFTIDYVDPLLRKSDPCGRGPYSFCAGSDWWALSVIAFEQFMGISPWLGRHPNQRYNEKAYRSFDYVVIGLDPQVRIPGTSARPLMRSIRWLESKPKLLKFFKDIFSNYGKRLSIAGTLETYFSRPESRIITSSLSQRLAELGVLKRADDNEHFWGGLAKRIEEVSTAKGDARAKGRERLLNIMLGM